MEGGGSRGRSLWRFLRDVVPNWIQAVVAVLLLLGAGAGGGAIASHSGMATGASKSTHEPQGPRLRPVLLDKAGPTDSSPGGTTTFGTGLASIAGAPFKNSVRQIYGFSCCKDQSSETFAVPDGYKRFQAWIGIETGGQYSADHTPRVTFEVDVGSAANTAFKKTMSYGDAAARVDVDVSGQRSVVLQTATDDTNCFTCWADAVWGDATLAP